MFNVLKQLSYISCISIDPLLSTPAMIKLLKCDNGFYHIVHDSFIDDDDNSAYTKIGK